MPGKLALGRREGGGLGIAWNGAEALHAAGQHFRGKYNIAPAPQGAQPRGGWSGAEPIASNRQAQGVTTTGVSLIQVTVLRPSVTSALM